ncbi:MAG: FAD-binding protein [SAR324 cluster bacterium]|nr:FAD-binding protein [SAR324 cluster bacterium]
MTAALVGVLSGQRTLMIEKSNQVGGTSATSSGTVWIPNNSYQRQHGITNDEHLAHQYLKALVGERTDRAMWETYIKAAPEMLSFLESQTDIRFRPYPTQPDYRQELQGAAAGWRPLEPMPFDGRSLGSHFDDVRWPLPELMLFGRMMITRGEAVRLLKMGRSLDSLLLGAKLLTRYAMDRIRYQRGTRLVIGNALVGRLYKNLLDRGASVWLSSAVSALNVESGRPIGLELLNKRGSSKVSARKGVILAGGGFPASRVLRERYLPSPTPQFTAAFEGCTGDTLLMAQAAGAALGTPGVDNALWFPSSVGQRKDGSQAVYPHIILDRAKPGLIAVNREGRRFVNEGLSYHDFTRAMYKAHQTTACIPARLVCDRRFIWKYGLGMIRPMSFSLKSFIERGYVQAADSLSELAEKIEVDPQGLLETVRLQNSDADKGIDSEFGKGSGLYERIAGDSEHQPNPCLGPIERAPFFSVAVWPTPLGTSLGLQTDSHGQVLDHDRQPLRGLYACGNDMHSPMGGEYPGAGSQLGIGMTFGYLSAKHAAREDGGRNVI